MSAPASEASLVHGSVPILMYHDVTPTPSPAYARYTVTTRQFAAHLRWLALARYTPVKLDALLDGWRGRGPLPRRPVVITFDDGFRNCVEFAVPALRRHGFPAMFYLVAGLVGQTSRWMVPSTGAEFPLFDWTSARRMLDEGMECGAHSLTHPSLAQCSPSECDRELVESRRLLEDRLGREIRHLAYPYGAVTPHVRAAAEAAGYASGCTTVPGLADPDDDLLLLRRVPVYGGDSLFDFASRLRTAESAAQTLRRRLPARALSIYRRLRGRHR